MSAARRCVDCDYPLSSNTPDYATRCRECHKNRPAQSYICIECQGAIGDDAPSYANRCMQCYRSHRRSGDSRPEARGPRAAPAPRSMASHLQKVYERKPVAPKPVPRQCVECQSLLDADVPADVKSCFTCIGKQMCHRQCEECQAPIAMDVPLELKSCYKCIGKKAVAKKRLIGPGTTPLSGESRAAPVTAGGSQSSQPATRASHTPLAPSGGVSESKSSLEPESKSPPKPESTSPPKPESKSPLESDSKSDSKWKVAKPKTKKTNTGCVECHAPISETAPSYANRCYECFVSVSKRQCVSCKGPIPNSAPLQADRCGSCKKRPVQGPPPLGSPSDAGRGITGLMELQEAKEISEVKEISEAKEITV